MDITKFIKEKSISDSRSAENIFQPSQTNRVERIKRFVNVHLHCQQPEKD